MASLMGLDRLHPEPCSGCSLSMRIRPFQRPRQENGKRENYDDRKNYPHDAENRCVEKGI